MTMRIAGRIAILIGALLMSSCQQHQPSQSPTVASLPKKVASPEREESFAFVELQTGTAISNATVELYRFATDISYDNPHPELLVATYRTDAKGIARIDPARIPQDRAVFHIAGYWTTHIRYSAVLDRLAMPGDIRGHIRIVRIKEYNLPILGNLIYDLDARKEYFVSLNGLTATNDLETIRVEMKKSDRDSEMI